MAFQDRLAEIRSGFERPFWVANTTEIFERLSYYAVFAALARYLHEALQFPTEQAASLSGWFGAAVWLIWSAATKGREAAEKLKTSLKSGKPLPAALQEAGGLKPEKIEPFTVVDDADAKNPPEKPKDQPTDMMMIKNVSSSLQPGEVSDFVPWIDGGLIVLLEKREPADPAKYQQTKVKLEENYLKNARDYVFMEWLRDRQRDAGLQSAKG